MILAIDEAGKGCVIGDLFVVGVVINPNNISKLKLLGVKDSKLLDKYTRERIFNVLITQKLIEHYYLEQVRPCEIDVLNLNSLLVDKYKNIISKALNEYDIQLIIIDSPLLRPKNLLNSLIKDLNFKGTLIVEHKADRKYVEVATASIIAKVLRDKHIEELKLKYGDFGSGYPSDSRTIRWLRDYYEKHGYLPGIVRKSWSTIRRIAPTEYVNKKSSKIKSDEPFKQGLASYGY